VPGSEWALVFFTLLAQAGVGTLIAGEISKIILNKKSSSKEILPLIFKTRLTAFILSSAALSLSFLHLGNPLKAFNALNNLRSSWLSREILAAVVFLFLLIVSILLSWKRKPSDTAAKIVVGAAILAGLFLILAMSLLYMLPGVLTWDYITTPLSFFTSTFLLGFMAAGGLSITEIKSFSTSSEKEPNSSGYFSELRTALNTTFILASIQILFAIITSLRIHNYKDIYSPFDPSLLLEHRFLFSLRTILLLAGMVLIFLTQIKLNSRKDPLNVLLWFYYSALTFILISEILGRHLFYAIFYRSGI